MNYFLLYVRMNVCMYVISGPHGRPDIMFYLHNYILSE